MHLILFWTVEQHGCRGHSYFWFVKNKKYLFSETTRPIGTKLCRNDVWKIIYKNTLVRKHGCQWQFKFLMGQIKNKSSLKSLQTKLCRSDVWKELYKYMLPFVTIRQKTWHHRQLLPVIITLVGIWNYLPSFLFILKNKLHSRCKTIRKQV